MATTAEELVRNSIGDLVIQTCQMRAVIERQQETIATKDKEIADWTAAHEAEQKAKEAAIESA